MDCSEAKSHLSAFASGLTNDLDRSEIEEHLSSCEDCSLEVELLRGRAAGQPSTPKPSDWTLETIFGHEGNGEGAPEAPAPGASAPEAAASEASDSIEHDARSLEVPERAPSPEPAPIAAPPEAPVAHPSLILPPPPIPAANESASDARPAAAKSKSGSWGFEPADAGKEAAPPEESLVFAEQALNRKRDGSSKSKAAARRVLIWSLGGVAGLGLLVVSAWIALAVHQSPPLEISTGAARSAPSPELSQPGEVEASDAPTPEVPIQAKSLPGISVPPAASDPARIAASSTTPAATTPSASTTSPDAPPSPVTAPGTTTAAPSPKAASATTKPPRDAATPKKVTVAAPAPKKPVKPDDDDMWPTDDPVHAGSAAKPVTPAPKSAVADVAPPATHATPPSSAPPSGEAAAPSAPLTPIDRLHLATEKAAEDRDLTSLRQAKTGWKALLRTTVGRDRSRTKREYADCVWEIQGLTGRDTDRLECLNAYRDYLLSAPAGGTDTRSAERLRQLEDALHEGE